MNGTRDKIGGGGKGDTAGEAADAPLEGLMHEDERIDRTRGNRIASNERKFPVIPGGLGTSRFTDYQLTGH